MIRQPRPLSQTEIDTLPARDLVASLASIDRNGFPHVIPIWFLWVDGAFWITSFADRQHLRRLARNPRAGISIDAESPELSDGRRPNEQVRAVGSVVLTPDENCVWTRRIRVKSQRDCGRLPELANGPRTVICLRPNRLVAVASV